MFLAPLLVYSRTKDRGCARDAGSLSSSYLARRVLYALRVRGRKLMVEVGAQRTPYIHDGDMGTRRRSKPGADGWARTSSHSYVRQLSRARRSSGMPIPHLRDLVSRILNFTSAWLLGTQPSACSTKAFRFRCPACDDCKRTRAVSIVNELGVAKGGRRRQVKQAGKASRQSKQAKQAGPTYSTLAPLCSLWFVFRSK